MNLRSRTNGREFPDRARGCPLLAAPAMQPPLEEAPTRCASLLPRLGLRHGKTGKHCGYPRDSKDMQRARIRERELLRNRMSSRCSTGNQAPTRVVNVPD